MFGCLTLYLTIDSRTFLKQFCPSFPNQILFLFYDENSMSYKGFDFEKGLTRAECHVKKKNPFFVKNTFKLISLVLLMDSERKLLKVSHFFLWKCSYLIRSWCNQCFNFKSVREDFFEKTKLFKNLLILTSLWMVTPVFSPIKLWPHVKGNKYKDKLDLF